MIGSFFICDFFSLYKEEKVAQKEKLKKGLRLFLKNRLPLLSFSFFRFLFSLHRREKRNMINLL